MTKIKENNEKQNKKVVERKIKVMFLSNHLGLVTGYSNVVRNICDRLADDDKFDIYAVGEQTIGMPIKFGKYPLLARRDGGQDMINSYLETIQPDYFVWLEDTFTMFNHGVNSIKFPKKTKFITYIPQDGDVIPTTGHTALKRADFIVPMAKWSKEVTEREEFKCTKPLYHGVNFNTFTPAKDEEEKKKIKKAMGFKEDDFIILYVARNSGRKICQAWCDIVAQFSQKYPNVKAFGHINGANAINNHLPDYVSRCIPLKYGDTYKKLLGNKIFFNAKAQSLSIGMNDSEMPYLYKIADVYFTSAIGEGFGMPITEAMSAEVPVVAVDFTTTQELLMDGPIKPRGFPVKYPNIWVGSFNVGHAILDYDDALKALDVMYTRPDLRKQMGENGRKFVKENCDWDKIVEDWKKLFIQNINKFHKDENSTVDTNNRKGQK